MHQECVEARARRRRFSIAMRIVLIAAALKACGPEVATVEPAPERVEVPTSRREALPPATGDRLVLWRSPCYGSCSVYTLEIYATGRVRWFGWANTSQLGAREFAVSPDDYAALRDAWAALDHDHLPHTPEAAVCGTDAPMATVSEIVDDVATTRWLHSTYGFGCWQDPPEEAACESEKKMWRERGMDYEALVALDEFTTRVDEVAGTGELVLTKPACAKVIELRAWILGFRVREAEMSMRLEPVRSAVRWLDEEPDSIVRIVGIDDAKGTLGEDVRFHRDALMSAGVEKSRIVIATLPHRDDNPWPGIEGIGGLQVGPPACFPPIP